MCLGQESASQPMALSRALDGIAKALPVIVQGQVDEYIALLTQHILPFPCIQLVQDRNGTELAVANDRYRYVTWYQLIDKSVKICTI